MGARREALPTGMQPRMLTREEAAAYCGLSPEGLSDWMRRGLVPRPIPGTHRIDRKALDAALDKLSGIEPEQEKSALARWKEARDARAAGRAA